MLKGRTMRTEREIIKSELKDEQGSISEKKPWNSPKVQSLDVEVVTQGLGTKPGDGGPNNAS